MNPRSLDPLSFAGPLPLDNPPLQTFGNYTADGTLLTPVMTSPLFTDDPNLFTYDDGPDGDSKRRRIAKVGAQQCPSWLDAHNYRLAMRVGARRSDVTGSSLCALTA